MKTIISRILGVFGLKISKIYSRQRNSLDGVLNNLKENLFDVSTVIDGGAAYGDFSKKVYEYFPETEYMLVEPLEEYKKYCLVNTSHMDRVKMEKCALASEKGSAFFNVHPDLFGSSLYNEVEGEGVDGYEKEVKLRTIDDIVAEYNLQLPYLLKLDLQGAEIDALKGASDTLKHGDNIVILEVSLFKTMLNSDNTLDNVIKFMKSMGYVVYDIWGFNYRPYDNALCQIDCAFCKDDSKLREFHGYADNEYRVKQFKKASIEHKLKQSI